MPVGRSTRGAPKAAGGSAGSRPVFPFNDLPEYCAARPARVNSHAWPLE